MATKFYSSNSQSDGVKILKRMEFEFMGRSFVFNLNPEEYLQSEPNRISVIQTKGGAWADDFGAGIPKITFKGTTGFKSKTLTTNQHNFLTSLIAGGGGNEIWAKDEFEREMVGFYKFKELRDLIREYMDKLTPGDIVTTDKELIFHNYTDGEHWIVIPEAFELLRSISRPLLYSYNISLICQRPANEPDVTADYGNIGKMGDLEYTGGVNY